MNSHLTYQMAQFQQQDLHRAGERARAARGLAGESRFAALYRRMMRTRFADPQPQPQGPDPLLRVKLGV